MHGIIKALAVFLLVSSNKTPQRGEDLRSTMLQAWSSTSEIANLCASGSICLYVSVEFIYICTVCMNRCNLRRCLAPFKFTIHFSFCTFSSTPYVHAATSQILKGSEGAICPPPPSSDATAIIVLPYLIFTMSVIITIITSSQH